MNLRQILATKGIHYLVTRFGWGKLRGLAFDEKYQRGDWNFRSEGKGELADVVTRYLRKGDLLIMGCGGAAILEGLEAAGLNSALGVDLSQEAIRIAGRFASTRVAFTVSDMETFECLREYDVILFSESLYYVSSNGLVPLLKRLAGRLKPGGVFVVTFAQAARYRDILSKIRRNFAVLEDRSFSRSDRHLVVFGKTAKRLDS